MTLDEAKAVLGIEGDFDMEQEVRGLKVVTGLLAEIGMEIYHILAVCRATEFLIGEGVERARDERPDLQIDARMEAFRTIADHFVDRFRADYEAHVASAKKATATTFPSPGGSC